MNHVTGKKRNIVKMVKQINESALGSAVTEAFVVGSLCNSYGYLDYLIEITVKNGSRCRGWLYSRYESSNEIKWHYYGWPPIVRWAGYDRHIGG